MIKLDRIRIIPKAGDFLDRNVGKSGEVYFNRATDSLRVYTGKDRGGVEIARADLSNIADDDFLAKAITAGVSNEGGGSFSLKISADDSTVRFVDSGNTIQFLGSTGIATTSSEDGIITITNTANTFNTVSVSGQTSILADNQNSVLTFTAGSNIVLSTDAVNNAVMISATAVEGTASNSFEVVEVSGQANVVADSSASVLTLAAGNNVDITTDAGTRTITIASTLAAASFNSLAESTQSNLTIDQIYLPAITSLTVGNSGASAYLFDQYAGNNPTIYAISGTTIAFKINASGHPFLIQNAAGNNFDTGLVHVSTTGAVSTGSSAQGKDSGTLYWKVPFGISGGYRYQCLFHAPMVGSITVKDIAVI